MEHRTLEDPVDRRIAYHEHAKEVVDKGAALLTQVLGFGWWNLINLYSFDIADAERCVLGHLRDSWGYDSEYDSFSRGDCFLRQEDGAYTARGYGFLVDVLGARSNAEVIAREDVLTKVWVAKIMALRSEHGGGES